MPLLFLMHLCIKACESVSCLVGLELPIYNTNRFVLQELGILLGAV